VGRKDENVLELVVRVLLIILLVHGASIRIKLLHEATTEDVVGLVPRGPCGEGGASCA